MKRDPIFVDGMHYYDLPVNPEPWRVGPLSMGRRRTGQMYPTVGRDQQLHMYQAAIREQLLDEWKTIALPDGTKFRAEYFFWRRQDSYESASGSKVSKHVVDLTNMIKGTEDALQAQAAKGTRKAIEGILFHNDRDCVEQATFVMAQGPDVEPRVVIGIQPQLDFPNPEDVMAPELIEALKIKVGSSYG